MDGENVNEAGGDQGVTAEGETGAQGVASPRYVQKAQGKRAVDEVERVLAKEKDRGCCAVLQGGGRGTCGNTIKNVSLNEKRGACDVLAHKRQLGGEVLNVEALFEEMKGIMGEDDAGDERDGAEYAGGNEAARAGLAAIMALKDTPPHSESSTSVVAAAIRDTSSRATKRTVRYTDEGDLGYDTPTARRNQDQKDQNAGGTEASGAGDGKVASAADATGGATNLPCGADLDGGNGVDTERRGAGDKSSGSAQQPDGGLHSGDGQTIQDSGAAGAPAAERTTEWWEARVATMERGRIEADARLAAMTAEVTERERREEEDRVRVNLLASQEVLMMGMRERELIFRETCEICKKVFQAAPCPKGGHQRRCAACQEIYQIFRAQMQDGKDEAGGVGGGGGRPGDGSHAEVGGGAGGVYVCGGPQGEQAGRSRTYASTAASLQPPYVDSHPYHPHHTHPHNRATVRENVEFSAADESLIGKLGDATGEREELISGTTTWGQTIRSTATAWFGPLGRVIIAIVQAGGYSPSTHTSQLDNKDYEYVKPSSAFTKFVKNGGKDGTDIPADRALRMAYIAEAFREEMTVRERAGAMTGELVIFDSFRLYFLQAQKTIGHFQVQQTPRRIDALLDHVAKEVVGLLRAPERIPPRMAAMRASIGEARGGAWPLMDLGAAGATSMAGEVAALVARVAALETQNKDLAGKVKTAEANATKGPKASRVDQVEQGLAGLRAQMKDKFDEQRVMNKIALAENRLKALIAAVDAKVQ